jgi:hypothetical protein
MPVPSGAPAFANRVPSAPVFGALGWESGFPASPILARWSEKLRRV